MMRLGPFEACASDLRLALRQMRRAPLFTLVAASTLALGIGANSAIFALADATLLRPLPFRQPDQLVLIDEHGSQQTGRSRVELLNFRDWIERTRSFEMMAAAWLPAGDGGPTTTARDGTAETVRAQTVTSQFFDVLGVAPIVGRTFRRDDESPDPSVVVLSEGFWRRRFASDRSVVGSPITLDGRPVTVIGIMPASFQFVRPASAWLLLPLPRAGADGTERGQCGVCRFLQVVGRVKPGVTIDAARTELAAMANALAVRDGDVREPRRITVTPLREVIIGRDLRVTALLFLGVVGFVLLLCCTNVANLLLARLTVRQRELAVRAALGAGRRRIVAQLLAESLALSAVGGVCGLGVGAAILAAAPAVIPAGLVPGGLSLTFDLRVALFSAVIAIGSGVLVGLAPAWHASTRSLADAMGSDARIAGGGGRLRSALVAAEIAVAVLVLCGAGLLLRTVLVLDGFDRGYRAEPDRVLTADFIIPALAPGSRYPDSVTLLQFFDNVEREVGAIPGVVSAGWATTLPLGGSQLGSQSFEVVGDPIGRGVDRPLADYQIVSPGYFRTIDLPIAAGRAFTERDGAMDELVCIVSEAFAARFLQGRNPIGVRIATTAAAATGPVTRTIVGVARQVKGRPDELKELIQIYVPTTQNAWPEAYLVVRTANGHAAVMAPAVRAAIARVDRLLPVNGMMTLEDVADTATGRHRFRASLVLAFAALALMLAMIGVFGVLAYSVQQRWREFGVRLAFGATSANVLALVLRSAARMVLAGTALGLAAAAALGGSLSAFIFGVQPLDPATFVAAAAVVGATSLAAAAVPALRASRIDPAVTFRNN